ncbi:hypothetical protein MNBD_GAMMA13-276 [hydrothermal vent metagenome]|uniref:SpoVT-AbrB domain-containing protein n=1 Tax=hydrothermal vent metagenome TaxID=652676 RepID=A0A3B0YFH9_9ZZZZ
MELEVLKWGNSAAIRINKSLLRQIKASVGASLVAEIRNGGLFLKPAAEPQYLLADLLSTCTKSKMSMNDEDRRWLEDAPVGKEA